MEAVEAEANAAFGQTVPPTVNPKDAIDRARQEHDRVINAPAEDTIARYLNAHLQKIAWLRWGAYKGNTEAAYELGKEYIYLATGALTEDAFTEAEHAGYIYLACKWISRAVSDPGLYQSAKTIIDGPNRAARWT